MLDMSCKQFCYTAYNVRIYLTLLLEKAELSRRLHPN